METISFKDWQKLDIRVGQIKDIKDHPNADKLYVFQVDIGDKEVTLCAGLKEYYEKEDLIDKKVIVFVNLEPKKLRGIDSQGMILCCQKDDKVFLLKPEKDIDNGANVC